MSRDAASIFRAARAKADPAERDAYLEGACGRDVALRAKVEALLAADAAAADFSAAPDSSTTGEVAGQQIGRYKLLQQIGAGGFGEVWMAEQREPVKRRVALKLIKLGMDTKQVIARFEVERQALAMMDHPNIAKVLDAGATEAGRPYFVMELVKGVPILEYCDTERLTTRSRLDLFKTVCHAIQHAHHKGIIHRDIKPSNVLITLHDGQPVPKVIDFGIAKATNAELTEKTLFTEYRQLVGTPAYMSPEQAEMSGLDVDTRTDVYSLGVLLYELLTGTTPFDARKLIGSGYQEMLRAIREDEPHKPSTRVSTMRETATRAAHLRRVDAKKLGLSLRGDLDWIVMHCLEKNRTRRYDSANDIAADVERHMNDEPVLAGPPSRGYRMRKFVRRHRVGVAAGALVTLALVLGVVGTTWGLLKAIEEKSRADEETARANEVKRLITEMLESVDPEKAQGRDLAPIKGILDDAADRLAKGDVKDELVAAELHAVIGRVYLKLGRYAEAERQLPISVEIRSRLLGPQHPDTVASTVTLAHTYWRLSRFADAERLFRSALEVRMRVLGEEHEDTLNSMRSLALCASEQGRYDVAEPLLQRAYETACRVLKEVNPCRLACMNDLALVLQNQGRNDEAKRMISQLMSMCMRHFGEEHRGTRISMHNLGCLYRDEGRYAEAAPLLTKALELDERILGSDHPEALQSKCNVALLFSEEGKDDEAERLLLQAQEVALRSIGEENSITLRNQNILAEVLRRRGRHGEAELLFERTLEVSRRVLGEEIWETALVRAGLAILYRDIGRYADAEALSLRTLEALKRQFDESHPDSLATITTLGLVYDCQGRYDEAAALLEANLPAIRSLLGMGNHRTWDAMKALIEADLARGRVDEARSLCRELLEILDGPVANPEAASKPLWIAAWILTRDLDGVRDPAKALALAGRAAAAAEKMGAAEPWRILDTFALAQNQTGDTASATETERRALELLPETHPLRGEFEKRQRGFEAALAAAK